MEKESTRVCIYKLKGKKETKLLHCMVVSNRPSQEALLKAVENAKRPVFTWKVSLIFQNRFCFLLHLSYKQSF